MKKKNLHVKPTLSLKKSKISLLLKIPKIQDASDTGICQIWLSPRGNKLPYIIYTIYYTCDEDMITVNLCL